MLHFPWINSISWFWVSPVYFSYTQHTHAHKHTHVYNKIHVSIWKTYQKKIGVLLSTARKYFLEGKLTRVCLCHEYKIVRVEFWYVCKFYDGFIFNCTLYKQTYTHTLVKNVTSLFFTHSLTHSVCLSFSFLGYFFFSPHCTRLYCRKSLWLNLNFFFHVFLPANLLLIWEKVFVHLVCYVCVCVLV